MLKLKCLLSKTPPNPPTMTAVPTATATATSLRRRLSTTTSSSSHLSYFLSLTTSTPTPPIHTFNAVLTHLRPLLPFRLLPLLPTPPDLVTHTILLDSASLLHSPLTSLSLLALMLKRNIPPDPVASASLLRSLLNSRLLPDAAGILFNLPSHDAFGYCCVVQGCCEMGRADVAFGVVGLMMKRACSPNVVVYNALLNGLGRADRVLGVAEVFAGMQLKCEPDLVTYNTVIGCVCRVGRVELGLGVVGVMLTRGFRPTVSTFTMVVHGLGVVRRIEDAELLFRRVVALFVPDVFMYGAMISAYCGDERVDEAFGVVGVMLKTGCRPSSVVVCQLIDGLCESRRIVDAFVLIEKMTKMGYEQDVISYSTLVKGLCSVGNTKMAIELLNLMMRLTDRCKPDVITYNTIIDTLCREGAMKEACVMLEDMIHNGVSPNAVTFRSLIVGYSVLGQLVNALVRKSSCKCLKVTHSCHGMQSDLLKLIFVNEIRFGKVDACRTLEVRKELDSMI